MSHPTTAHPGTYGEAPPGFRLPDGTHLGPVVLQVADLDRSLRFYESVLGFRVLSRTGNAAVLAALSSTRPLLELRSDSSTSRSCSPIVRRSAASCGTSARSECAPAPGIMW
jgi:hypothetical protein